MTQDCGSFKGVLGSSGGPPICALLTTRYLSIFPIDFCPLGLGEKTWKGSNFEMFLLRSIDYFL